MKGARDLLLKAKEDLARVRTRIAELRSDLEEVERRAAAERDRIGQLLADAEKDDEELTIFIKRAASYEDDSQTISPLPHRAARPKEAAPKAPPANADREPTRLSMSTRRPYGSGLETALAAVEIIRETGRPWHTRDLVEELLRHGFVIGGRDPITNLSNKLGKVGLLRSNRVMGWHLKEWPEHQPTDRIALIRGALAREAVNATKQSVVTEESPLPSFQGVGLPEAAVSVLRKYARPMGNVEISEALDEANYPFTARDHYAAVEAALRRRASSYNDVLRVAAGTWGLMQWYTAEQIKKFKATDFGGNPGRDAAAHLKSTQDAVAASLARGVKFGRRPALAPDQMRSVKVLLSEGEKPKDIAKVFGVTPTAVSKWASKWAREAKEQTED